MSNGFNSYTAARRKKLEAAIVRAARSWFYCDRPQQGRPSGLRMLTARSVWYPNPAELRLARRVSDFLDIIKGKGKR